MHAQMIERTREFNSSANGSKRKNLKKMFATNMHIVGVDKKTIKSIE